jgi:4'-phosphopantetheinyl transferase EntD
VADRDRIAALLPPFARYAGCAIEGTAPPLHPDEECFVARAVEKRRRTFAFGRACARRALGEDVAILVGEGGAPVWPPGVFGSITHTDDDAAAVIATVPIGIDLESRAEVARVDLRGMVALPSEHEYDPALLFSAKESVYKCLYAGEFLEFHDVELAFDHATFRVLRAGRYDVEGVVGRFALTDTHVATVVVRTARVVPAE